MKHDLQEKTCVLRKSSKFWDKVLKMNSVPPWVEAIMKTVKTDVDA
jgi:hypothetical protein